MSNAQEARNAERQRRAAARRALLDNTLVGLHAEAHRLLDVLLLRVDSVPASADDGASWGDVGDLGYIVSKLTEAVNEE